MYREKEMIVVDYEVLDRGDGIAAFRKGSECYRGFFCSSVVYANTFVMGGWRNRTHEKEPPVIDGEFAEP